MQTDIQRKLLRDVRSGLSSLAPRLEAYWAAADPGKDAEIFFLGGGFRHVVYVQVGANFASVNVMSHAVVDLGAGIRQGVFEALTQGAPRRPVWEKIAPDLGVALGAHPDAFEPSRMRGVALHHEFPVLLRAALHAFEGLPGGPWSPVANGGDDGVEDTLAFVGPDGGEHAVRLATHPQALAEITVEGRRYALVGRDVGQAGLSERLLGVLSEEPAPLRGVTSR